MAERVLIADDEPISREILRRTLERAGYEVVAVADGEAAWRVLEAPDAPGLTVLDWMMPGLDGPEICRRLRQRSHERGYTYVLLLTGKDSVRDVLAGLEAGADDYVVKPFAPEIIEARLRVGRRILALEAQLRAERSAFEHLARHDTLTGLWNRRVILEHLEAEISRARRHGGCVGAVLGDIDHFKSINDTHGHPVGDEVLVQVARRLRDSLRTYDGLGRYGGEEFLAVMACRSDADAALVADRLLHAVADEPFATSAGALHVTISLGVATTLTHSFDSTRLLAASDAALYQAKHDGRNRLVVAGPELTGQPEASIA
jgi:two-component system cell cycle response regulator